MTTEVLVPLGLTPSGPASLFKMLTPSLGFALRAALRAAKLFAPSLGLTPSGPASLAKIVPDDFVIPDELVAGFHRQVLVS